MATLNLGVMRNLIRSDLNESGPTMLTDAEINRCLNDGYKDVAIKSLCYENKIAFNNIPVSQKIIPLIPATNHIIRVNFVEYKTGTTQGGLGMLGTLPQVFGHKTVDTDSPQYWFQWGDYLIIDPLPDVGTYDLEVYAACYPAAVLTNDSDLPSSLPPEFHEDMYYFALAFAALKLKRWGDFGNAYNRYIVDLQRKRSRYVMKETDTLLSQKLPNTVTMQEVARGR